MLKDEFFEIILIVASLGLALIATLCKGTP
jgi:hypothetical protein